MLEKFNVKKIEKELKDINKTNNIKNGSGIQLIMNNMLIYNDLIDRYMSGELNKVYILYQLNGQIFKQLKEYNVFPKNFKDISGNSDEYIFNKVKKNVEKR